MSGKKKDDGLRVTVVNPREKPRKRGERKKKTMAKAKRKKTTHKRKTTHHKARRRTSHHTTRRRSSGRRLRRRSNPGFGFSGKALLFAAAGGAGAAGVDFATSMIPLSPTVVGGIETAVGAGLAACVDHPIAKAGGAVLMTMGAFKLMAGLLAPKSGGGGTGTAGKSLVSKKALHGIEHGAMPHGGSAYSSDVESNGVGLTGIDDAIGELEAGDDLDGLGDGEDIGELEAAGDYIDGVGELEAVYELARERAGL